MAATFVVEDGSSLSNANAYITVALADQYNDDQLADATWLAATDAAKEMAIRKATQYLDDRFNRRWKGRRSDRDQSLDWPRVDVLDNDGFGIDSDEMPKALLDAVTELAIKSAGGEDLMPDITAPGTIKREMKKVGPITTDTEYTGGKSQIKRYRKVDGLLRGLVLPAGEMLRG